MIIPKKLKTGDKIGIVSTARKISLLEKNHKVFWCLFITKQRKDNL